MKKHAVGPRFASLLVALSLACAEGTSGPATDVPYVDPGGIPIDIAGADPGPVDPGSTDPGPGDPGGGDPAPADPGTIDPDAGDADATDTGGPDAAVNPAYAPLSIRIVEHLSPEHGTKSAYAYVQNYGGTEEMPSVTAAQAGECVLKAPVWDPPCEPPCVWPRFCGADAVCVTRPETTEAGSIEVTGLTSKLLFVVETQYHYYSAQLDPEPSGDLFDAGAIITANAAGGEIPAFTLTTTGGEPLAVDMACPTPLPATGPLVLKWTPDPTGSAQTVVFRLASPNHGTQFLRIDCESPDDGEVVVERALLDAYSADWHPAGTLWSLERYRGARKVIDGFDVRLEAASATSCRVTDDAVRE